MSVNDFVSERQSEVMKRLSNQNPTILTVVNDLNRGKTRGKVISNRGKTHLNTF